MTKLLNFEIEITKSISCQTEDEMKTSAVIHLKSSFLTLRVKLRPPADKKKKIKKENLFISLHYNYYNINENKEWKISKWQGENSAKIQNRGCQLAVTRRALTIATLTYSVLGFPRSGYDRLQPLESLSANCSKLPGFTD